jgi:AraC-like DNA-binding protein
MKLGVRTTNAIEPGTFARPAQGIVWADKELGLPVQGFPAWESKPATSRNSCCGKLHTLESTPPDVQGSLTRIHVLGIFGVDSADLKPGDLGATLVLGPIENPLFHLDLINDRHFSDPSTLHVVDRLTGDGASVESVGRCEMNGRTYRVDLLTVDVEAGISPGLVTFTDVSEKAQFLIFDVFYEVAPSGTCPFKSRSGGVALSELAAVVRLGDRVTLRRALDQLQDAVTRTQDLDEAKGEALTFIAVVTAATIEMGVSRTMHRVQLEAARRLDALDDPAEIVAETRFIVEELALPASIGSGSPSGMLIDRALTIVGRNFAKDISDTTISNQLGLSTSHFRYLFREVTGQPFHKYLIALRLEKARRLLLEAAMPVSDVASAVGFNGLAHFSRAFTQRFSVSPTNLRRSAPALSE